MDSSQVRRKSRPLGSDVIEENGGEATFFDDALFEKRRPTSTRRYKAYAPPSRDTTDDPGIVYRRRSRGLQQETIDLDDDELPQSAPGKRPARKRRISPLLLILVGGIMTIVLFMLLNVVFSWWQLYQDDLHYGRPRTSHLDAVVGHEDSKEKPTHFIFLNLDRHIQVVEIPGGDPSKVRIFPGPILLGDGQDLTPVTGEVKDVDGDGKPDLLVHIQNQQIIFYNDGKTFKAR